MISVVIPTKDRRDELVRTLGAVAAQSPPEGGFEVVVVDNGSADGSPEAAREAAGAAAAEIRVVVEPRRGPAAARNRGVREARGETILFLGDDTEPRGDGLVAAHARLHREAADARFGVLGGAEWSDRQTVTPFMRWLVEAGYQFDFGSLAPGRVAARDAFWTAHVSLSRELFDEAGGFDERFPYAAVEDVELGARLDRAGIRLAYHPELVVLHTHPTGLDGSLERMRRVGRSAALLHEIDPGFDAPGLPRPGSIRPSLLRASAPLWRGMAGAPAAPERLRRAAWKALHLSAYARGFREGPPAPAPRG